MEDRSISVAAEGESGEAEGKYRGLFDSIKDGAVMTDTNGVILDCNQACLDTLRCTKEEIKGVKCARIVPSLSPTRIHEIGRQVQTGGSADEFEVEALRKDRTVFSATVKCCLARDELGLPLGIWVIFQDITERKTARKSVEKQKEELQRLIDVAAYELRQLATVFKGYSYLLMESGGEIDAESFMEAISSIDEAASGVTHIVNELDDTSRIERGQLNPVDKEVYPHKLIRRAVEEMRVKGCDRDFVLSTYADESSLVADPEAIKQVLTILLENADKFSPDKTPISIWHVRRGAETVFHVADRGQGIFDEDLELIFERFYQGKDAMRRPTRGIGLGLYIAKKMVEAHGGWIKVELRENGGSDFSFGIPEIEWKSNPAEQENSIQGRYMEAGVSA